MLVFSDVNLRWNFTLPNTLGVVAYIQVADLNLPIGVSSIYLFDDSSGIFTASNFSMSAAAAPSQPTKLPPGVVVVIVFLVLAFVATAAFVVRRMRLQRKGTILATAVLSTSTPRPRHNNSNASSGRVRSQARQSRATADRTTVHFQVGPCRLYAGNDNVIRISSFAGRHL
jgi:hypothetical protein